MNTTIINSSLLFNHSSSGSNLPLEDTFKACIAASSEYVADYVIKVINLALGYPANIMVVWLVYRNKSDSTSDIFILNLAIADACCCLFVHISMVGTLRLKISNFWTFYHFAYGIKDASPVFLTCICLDRYVAVVHPILFTRIRDSKIRLATAILAWGFALPFAAIRSWSIAAGDIFSGLVLATFTIMVFCNISIMWSLRKSVFGKEKMHPMKKKAHRTVLIALAIVFFHYLPIVAVLNILRFIEFQVYCPIKNIAYMLLDLSSSIEPLIYISKMEQLPCFNSFPCICCRGPSTEPQKISA